MKNTLLLITLCCGVLLLSGCGKKSDIDSGVITTPVINETVLAAVEKDGLRGYIDLEGNRVIEPRYKQAFQFSNGFAAVTDTGLDPLSGSVAGGQYYWITTAGKIVNTGSDEAFHFYGDHSFRSQGAYYYQVDKEGKDLSGPYVRVRQGFDGPDKVELEDGRQIYIDGEGTVLFENSRDVSTPFVNGYALVMKDDIVNHIDRTGSSVYEGGFSTAGEFSEGFAAVEKDKKWGFIDETGKVIIPYIFDNVVKFSDGLAGVQLAGKRGVINTTGDIIIQPKYLFLGLFNDFYAPASYDGETVLYITGGGQEAVSTNFSYGSQFRQGLSIVNIEGKLGYINNSGITIIEPVYERASYFVEVDKPNKFERLD